MYAQNELLYPHRITPELRSLRKQEWQALIDRVSSLPESHEEVLAFSMMMVRLNGCLACETDSYRAMRGCLYSNPSCHCSMLTFVHQPPLP